MAPRPYPHVAIEMHNFQKRATYEQTRTTWRAVGFTLLGLLLVGLIFCIVVSILICKNKATARRRREKQDPIELAKFSEPRPTYMMVPMIVAPDQAPRELGTANRGESGRSWEVDHARPGEADGHPIPERRVSPAELPSKPNPETPPAYTR